MEFYAKLYDFYHAGPIRLVRVSLLVILLLMSYVMLGIHPNIFLLFLGIFIVFEIFYKYKVKKLMPKSTVTEANNFKDTATLEAMSVIVDCLNSDKLIKKLLKLPEIKFIVNRAKTGKDLERNIVLDQIRDKALEVAKQVKGKYVTTMDLFVAYLLLSEPLAKTLFNAKLKEQDILNILVWVRQAYPGQETPKKFEYHFWGEGFAEEIVYGWTVEAKKYMVDMTGRLIDKNQTPIGREEEYRGMLEALANNKSLILVGETGSGKTAAVEALALESFYGKLGGNLFHQKIYQLMVDAFMAGATNKGEVEERLDALIQEVAHAGNVIIFLPDFQNILGSTTFQLDISGAILPYVENGMIRIIGTVTQGVYKKYVEPLHSLLESFAVVEFETPSEDVVLEMLFRKALYIEKKDKVYITYRAILHAFKFADKYSKERALPGSAVNLLEDTAAAVALARQKVVDEEDVLTQVEKKVKVAVGEPKPVEKELLLNLETEIHKRIIGQDEAVSAISEAIRRERTGLNEATKPISFLFLGPTGVGKTETARVLSNVYFGTEQVIRLDMSEYGGDEGQKRLLGSGPGEGDEKGQLTEAIFDNPYSLVLLDEFEKADNKVLDLFLQVFDEGRLTDNKGKTVSFADAIIIATSNAGSEFIREAVGKGVVVDKTFRHGLLEYLQTQRIFRPELLNRFDGVIVFKPLDTEQITRIIGLALQDFVRTLAEKDIKIQFDQKILDKISKEGVDKEFGARPLKRYVQDYIEDPIAKKMLADEIKRGDSISASVDVSNSISFTKL